MIIKPDYNLKNIYEITPKMLLDMGIKAIFLDLDSTIMVSKSGKFTPKTMEWFEKLKKDAKYYINENYEINPLSFSRSSISVPRTFFSAIFIASFSISESFASVSGFLSSA